MHAILRLELSEGSHSPYSISFSLQAYHSATQLILSPNIMFIKNILTKIFYLNI